ncbi:hypothetical protein ASPACDRAFT_1859300 [Aspergillus aculeatus ATCC 16872]|uniref:Zn(2)-C6 fungal-type domain-containing protein n=1 Tax=Aspergillus aculeatus (strain ATCC 16872 / CBS 172.66 / WB 5094) TaxID=690307 RepID=A0A1L9WKD7_ASPA1|nr:uncharacterized protein ASPACDRAFT_1859300 [Aspergillus aculeatus ATCC 16872]OJJ96627.1 hypothetical protein ASPACDRAFT_1859300 [Aspergillus aculeatus ATCC 16872]
MPRVAPGQRKRSYRPKTRSGCLTCKYRRIRCTEERPACLRCTSTGRVCDGYEAPPPLPSSSLTTLRSKAFTRPLVPQSLGDDLLISDQERRSFQFFIAKTAPQLAGDFECVFWERLLLQSAHHEPAIRHVTIALGSLHERLERDSGTSYRAGIQIMHDPFALRQYLCAMRYLMPTPGGSQPLDVCLMSCILFACFEAMRGQYGSAITHITSGLKILDELRANPFDKSTALSRGRMPYVPIDVVCGLFTRLQAQIIVTVHRMSAARCNLWPELVIDLDRPIVFHSLADARETLEIYTYYYRQRNMGLQHERTKAEQHSPFPKSIKLVNGLNHAAVALRDVSISLLGRWSTALDDFLRERSAPLTDRERRGLAVLQLRKIDCLISLDIFEPAGQAEAGDNVDWDKYCAFFEEMVTLGESIVGFSPISSPFHPSDAVSSSPLPTPKTFSLDLGIIAAMFNVAVRCRDPHIRRRAVRVLRASAVQEGVWNSAVVAAIADKWIEIEEEGLDIVTSCADVPAIARVSDFLPVFDGEEPTASVYYSHSAAVNAGGVRKEVFRW